MDAAKNSPQTSAGSFGRAFADHKYLFLVDISYMVFTLAFALYWGTPLAEFNLVLLGLAGGAITAYAFMGAAYGATFLLQLERFLKEGRGWRSFHLADKETAARAGDYVTSPVFAYGMMGILAWLPCSFMIVYKSLIPFVNPYHWDPLFAEIDKTLHFGRYPYQIITPLVEGLGLPTTLDFVYALWALVLLATGGYALFRERNLFRRMRFIWCFVITWIVGGSFLALYFSSVGPLFYHQFYPQAPDIFKPLIDGLNRANDGDYPMTVFSFREKMVEWVRNDRHIDPNGLSAMPSLHMWTTTLMILYWRGVKRWAFALLMLFGFLLFGAVVYIGPHYAIDCYASILLMLGLWYLVSRCLKRRYPPEMTI